MDSQFIVIKIYQKERRFCEKSYYYDNTEDSVATDPKCITMNEIVYFIGSRHRGRRLDISMIEFDNVSFVRDERVILDRVNLRMESGENWVILGKNGSGKSTILEMMNGYLFPTRGTVRVLGNTYGQVDVREARRSIGYISQTLLEKLSLSDPAWEVVATGEYGFLRFYEPIPPQLKEKAVHMLEQVRLSHLQDQPLGLLSQGERKKVLLARSLMTSPALLVMDEACAGLDLYERENLLADLPTFRDRGIQMIYVTHHIEEMVPVFSHVLLIHEGRVVAAGKKEEVLTSERIREAYQVDVAVDWHEGRPWIRVLGKGARTV